MLITAMASTPVGIGLVGGETRGAPLIPSAVVAANSLQLKAAGAPARPLYLIVNGSRGLSPDSITLLRRLADQAGLSSTIVHQGTIDLRSIQRATTTVRAAPDGAGVPMSVLAVDALAIEPTTSSVVAEVTKNGAVVVGSTAASLSGVKQGDGLTLVDWNGNPVRVSVGAIEPDAAIGSAEIMMSLVTASTLGLDRPFSIRMWGFRDRQALDVATANIVRMEAGQTIRVRSSQRSPSADDTIPQAQLKALLGDFWIKRGKVGALKVDPSWKAANVAVVDLPIVGNVTCNTTVAKAAAGALQELRDAGLASLVHRTDSRRYGGCFSARVTRSLTGNSGHNLSRHTWGAAVDLNPSDNPYGGPSNMDQRVITAFSRHGFVWGGTFIVPDPMHFEYTGR